MKLNQDQKGVVAFVILVVLALLALMVVRAHAHDHQRADLNGWFKGLYSHKGSCCDGSDALHLRDVDWEVKDKHYRVRIPKAGSDMARAAAGDKVETEWVDVPDDAVIEEPNRDGATLVWPIYGAMGVSIRCFMPGTMT